MNRTSLILRDADYIAKLLHRKVLATDEEKQKAERIILRLLHRNNLEMTNTVLLLYNELEESGISILDDKAVDLMKARLYNLIRRSCGIADENNKTIIPKKERSK